MRNLILVLILSFFFCGLSNGQEILIKGEKKQDLVWSGGLYKSWLMDEYVDFHQVNDKIFTRFSEEHKMGLVVNMHYIYQLMDYVGIGGHIGLGIDVNSFVEAPVLVFGGSLSLGRSKKFLINFGWADGKRRKISNTILDELSKSPLNQIPILSEETELNTGYYLGFSYRFH